MAVSVVSRNVGVTVAGKRSVTMVLTFSDGTAADITKKSIGLRRIDEVYIKAKTSLGTGIDLTANDSTKVTLDPVAAVTAVTVVFVGFE